MEKPNELLGREVKLIKAFLKLWDALTLSQKLVIFFALGVLLAMLGDVK